MPTKLPTNSAVRARQAVGCTVSSSIVHWIDCGATNFTGSSPLPTRKPHRLPTPSDHMAGVDLSLSIGDALHQLTDEQRAVIIAIDVEGLPLAEGARRLDLPVGTIKSRSSRARARLARLLGHLVDPDMDVGGIVDARAPQPT